MKYTNINNLLNRTKYKKSKTKLMKYTYVNNGMSKLIVVFNAFISNSDMSSKQLQKK